MAINLVRKPSETPNINNYDDYRMFRYATGGYNGVIEKYGNECDYEINGNTFKIKSGEIVIDGVQSKIDSVGVELTVDNVAGTEYYTVYCEVNLSLIDNQKTEIKATKSIVNYPVIDTGDDLTEIQTGVARLELYRFTTSSGEISNVIKRFNLITLGQAKNAENATNATNATNAENAENAENANIATELFIKSKNVSLSYWDFKNWIGLTYFIGEHIWTDGINIYYSDGNTHYKLINGDTWVSKTWTGLTSFYGEHIWTDGINIYYSNENNHYKLNGDTWVSKTWTGLTSFYGNRIWRHGINIYYSNGNIHYKLNGDTWAFNNWIGITNFNGFNIWTDGITIYYSDEDTQYKLINGNTWVSKTWTGLTSFYGNRIWTDGINIYYSNGDTHNKLSKKAINAKPTLKQIT
jgi:hypothetical protein